MEARRPGIGRPPGPQSRHGRLPSVPNDRVATFLEQAAGLQTARKPAPCRHGLGQQGGERGPAGREALRPGGSGEPHSEGKPAGNLSRRQGNGASEQRQSTRQGAQRRHRSKRLHLLDGDMAGIAVGRRWAVAIRIDQQHRISPALQGQRTTQADDAAAQDDRFLRLRHTFPLHCFALAIHDRISYTIFK
ncbi:hypothetical protein LMIY3S_04540 [Labrys miyagiensis]